MRTVVSYGAGINSTALLIGLHNRNERPDAIVFADTGGERPETYSHISLFSEWLISGGFPAIETIIRSPAKVGSNYAATLEDECLMRGQLPGIAYGFGSCSDKWKQQPFKSWLKAKGWQDVTVCIGFDADEPHRAIRGDKYDSGYIKRYPLIEWDWGRDECVAAIIKAGIDLPGKSACFFCPSSKTREILALPKYLQDRALAMEANAELTTIKGLGRNYAWADLIRADKAQGKFDFETRGDAPCGCYDGGED